MVAVTRGPNNGCGDEKTKLWLLQKEDQMVDATIVAVVRGKIMVVVAVVVVTKWLISLSNTMKSNGSKKEGKIGLIKSEQVNFVYWH